MDEVVRRAAVPRVRPAGGTPGSPTPRPSSSWGPRQRACSATSRSARRSSKPRSWTRTHPHPHSLRLPGPETRPLSSGRWSRMTVRRHTPRPPPNGPHIHALRARRADRCRHARVFRRSDTAKNEDYVELEGRFVHLHATARVRHLRPSVHPSPQSSPLAPH